MKNPTWLKLTLLLTAMMTMMAGAVVAPSLPQINEVFRNVPKADLLTRLVITLPALTMAIFSPIYGKLIDTYGRKPWLVVALIIYAISGTSGYYLNDIYLILIGRALLGVAVAGIMTICTTLVGDYFAGAERAKFLGIQGAFIGLGGVVFITIAGILADIKWQAPFLIYLFSLPVLLLVVKLIYEPKIIIENKITEGKSETLKNNNKLILIIYLTVFFIVVCFYMAPVQIPYMLMALEGVNNTMVGIAISVSTLTSAILSMNYKRIKGALSFTRIYMYAFLLMGIGYFFVSRSSEYWHFIVALAINGTGVGLFMPTGALWIMEISPAHLRGRLMGGASTAMFLGIFFSPIIVQPLINSVGYYATFFTAAVFLILGAVVYLLLGRIVLKNH